MFTIITLVKSLNLNRQWPSVRLNALAVSGTGQARSLEALSHILTQQVLLHLMTHIFFYGWDFLPNTTRLANRTQADPSQLYYATVSAADSLFPAAEGGDLSRKGRAGGPTCQQRNLTAEHCCSLTGAQQSDAYELKGNTLVLVFIRRLQRGKIKMGGNISQKKGSRRSSSRSHGKSVMWVRTLTCLILILQWIIKKDIYRHLVLIIDLKLVMYVVPTVSVAPTKLAFFFHLVREWPLSTHLHTHANIHTPSEWSHSYRWTVKYVCTLALHKCVHVCFWANSDNKTGNEP